MSLLFALRGNALPPRYAVGGKLYTPFVGAPNLATLPAVVLASSIGAVGAKGTSLIDVRRTNSDERALIYHTGANWVSGTNVFTIEFSFIPNWDGNPPVDQTLFMIGGNNNFFAGGIRVQIFDNGKMAIAMRTGDGVNSAGSEMLSAAVTASALSFTKWVKKEIKISCDGTNVYLFEDGALIGTFPLVVTNRYMNSVLAGKIYLGVYSVDTLIDQFLVFSDAQTSAYTPSSSYYPCADYDGTACTALSPEQVQNGVVFGVGPGSQTGTGKMAVAATTKIGVAANDGNGTYDGSDRHTHPTADQVAKNVQFKNNSLTNNVTGTLDNVTNVIGNHALEGALDGILEAF